MKELGRTREGGRLGGEKEDDWEMGMGKVLELERKRGGGEGGGKQVGKDGGGGGEGGREVGKQGVGKEVGGEMAQGKQGCEGGGSLQEEGGGEQGVGWMFGLVFWMSGLVFWMFGLILWMSGLVFWMSGLVYSKSPTPLKTNSEVLCVLWLPPGVGLTWLAVGLAHTTIPHTE